ncbi:MAG TPA: uroporphyrinogen-III synthase [Puia sp.]|nr:uroporphyrinogen-III synthase [Puia sp.]
MSGLPPYRLLSTGDTPGELVGEMTARGFVMDVVPFIGIEAVEIKIPVTDVAVFTSSNAVNAIRPHVKEVVPEWRIYCIDGATFEAVAEIFGERSVMGKSDSASGLATLIVRSETSRRGKVVFFCGDQRREELPLILRDAGLNLTEMVVYRTVLTPHRQEKNYDGIVFFSPSAAESFFSVNRIGKDVPLFAIGPTTAAAIHMRCSNPVIIGERPDKALLLRRMTEYFLTQ